MQAGTAHVPIIAMTGFTSAEEQARCAAAGMTGHLAKPFTKEDLKRAIEGAAAS